jgi:predicted DNA-binding antitoxin AbrB/MazE fold protein
MLKTIKARYKKGIIEPLEKVDLMDAICLYWMDIS